MLTRHAEPEPVDPAALVAYAFGADHGATVDIVAAPVVVSRILADATPCHAAGRAAWRLAGDGAAFVVGRTLRRPAAAIASPPAFDATPANLSAIAAAYAVAVWLDTCDGPTLAQLANGAAIVPQAEPWTVDA